MPRCVLDSESETDDASLRTLRSGKIRRCKVKSSRTRGPRIHDEQKRNKSKKKCVSEDITASSSVTYEGLNCDYFKVERLVDDDSLRFRDPLTDKMSSLYQFRPIISGCKSMKQLACSLFLQLRAELWTVEQTACLTGLQQSVYGYFSLDSDFFESITNFIFTCFGLETRNIDLYNELVELLKCSSNYYFDDLRRRYNRSFEDMEDGIPQRARSQMAVEKWRARLKAQQYEEFENQHMSKQNNTSRRAVLFLWPDDSDEDGDP